MLQAITSAAPFVFACPNCRAALAVTPASARCPICGATFVSEAGIWRFLSAERSAALARFEREYHTVRRAEGWGSDDPSYYRALPWRDVSGRFAALWRIRATSFSTLLAHAVRDRRPMRILDLGSGNGWLAYQLARRGHSVAALDIQTDAHDGLGAWPHYDATFTPIQAEFDRLPLADGQADLAVFNGSLHYSADYAATLTEALRVLRPDGLVAVLDSPMYAAPSDGAAMIDERRARFQRAYGFVSDALPSEHYLTPRRVHALGQALGLRWRTVRPFHGWRWALRPYLARLRGGRQPAEFPVLIGERV